MLKDLIGAFVWWLQRPSGGISPHQVVDADFEVSNSVDHWLRVTIWLSKIVSLVEDKVACSDHDYTLYALFYYFSMFLLHGIKSRFVIMSLSNYCANCMKLEGITLKNNI